MTEPFAAYVRTSTEDNQSPDDFRLVSQMPADIPGGPGQRPHAVSQHGPRT